MPCVKKHRRSENTNLGRFELMLPMLKLDTIVLIGHEAEVVSFYCRRGSRMGKVADALEQLLSALT